MHFLKKNELVLVLVVLLSIGFFSYFNLKVAIRRSRDFQRKDDITNISNALFAYHEDMGFYPPNSPDGRIMACVDGKLDPAIQLSEIIKSYRPCDWVYDGLINPATGFVYLKQIPGDPYSGIGTLYRYIATRDHFQMFASLEGHDEAEFDTDIEVRRLICGTSVCNFGKGSPNTPLDKSLEEYENELKEQ